MWKRALITLAATAAVLAGAERTTLFIDRMDGFEEVVEEAIRNTELPVEFIEEREHPDLKVLLGKQFTSVSAEIIYEKQTGRRGGLVLRAVDVKTGKEVASETFGQRDGAEARKRAAGRFAQKLKTALGK